VDLGTGDGQAVVRLARANPAALVIGVDADATGMREASRRAARKNGLPNALFLVGDASAALCVLQRRVDELRITLPWGSLLGHVLHGEREFALAVAGSV
jgi:16S rRNA (adenine(1408)-N(1))-methyltransferase